MKAEKKIPKGFPYEAICVLGTEKYRKETRSRELGDDFVVRKWDSWYSFQKFDSEMNKINRIFFKNKMKSVTEETESDEEGQTKESGP